ncbi:hypothetical protein [Pseudonocardia sp. T1-2H]|uniref:hypothetical protein n=1 Tax=Pseudonocardia sp. T1-2H TaxID=3128899 RepID=UPI00310134C7
MRCTRCGWPTDEARTLSTHRTSEGWVRYRLCVCGAVSIQHLELADTGVSEQGVHATAGTES